MTPERFQQIEELYHAVREGTAEQRAALLANADPELRREVESLLSNPTRTGLLDRPVLENAAHLLEDETRTEMISGATLGPYRIESKLGEGGMGEVFRAVDTRLGRAVAIKTARANFTDRFEREARAISALNHPNICTLYDVGPNYLVMELVEGDSLAALLKSGPLPLATVLLYGSQIAAALVEAQSKGIVHRDLKPGNIMIGKAGVKVLDFGLARSRQDESVTGSHMVIGTPAYMAPEQRAGKPADTRTDIYAFGLILYEMSTGTRPGPQRKRIRPASLERIAGRCLEEDPVQRWQTAAELQTELTGATAARPWTQKAVLAAAALLALVAAAYFYFRPSAKLTSKDAIVLADFENNTGDPVFDSTLRQGLAVQLEQSPFLSMIADGTVQKTLRLMNRPVDTRLTPAVAREICERTGSTAVLDGSIVSLGDQYVLSLRANNCINGQTLAQEQVQAQKKENVLNALSQIAIQLRTRLGESLATIQEHSTPLEQATTSSLEALKAYSAAKIASSTVGYTAALPHLRRAIAIDPQFAVAHADLGFYSGQTDVGAEEIRKAYALRERVSERERLYISMLYDRQVTGNLEKELQTLEAWEQLYPRDSYAPGLIAGWVTRGTGQYERGIEAAKHSIQLEPTLPFPWEGLALHNLLLNRFPEAAVVLQGAAERKMELAEFIVHRYFLAFFQGDQAGMDREIAHASGGHTEDAMAEYQGLAFARTGRMREARTKWDRSVALAVQSGLRERAALFKSAEAVSEAHFGNAAAAREYAHAALNLSKDRDVEYAAGFALALSGDLAESQKLADDLAKRFPEDTPVQFEYLPILQALKAIAHHAPADAVALLQRALPYDFALPGTGFLGKFGGGYPAYVRGVAYLEAGRGREAATEFQKVLDHRGVLFADPAGALAHIQLGRALVLMGEKDKAKRSYAEFLGLWKEADSDLPVLKQARAEYSKLD